MNPTPRFLLLLLLLPVSVLPAACDDADPDLEEVDGVTLPPGAPSEAEVAATPRAFEDVERLALRCTDDLIARQDRYDALVADLAAVEAAAGYVVEDFYATHHATRVWASLPATDACRVASGGHPVFEALTERLGGTLAPLGSCDGAADALPMVDVAVDFAGVYADAPLQALYEAALELSPGAVGTTAPGGDGDHLAFDLSRWPHRYHHRRGGGDCPAGCTTWREALWEVAEGGQVTLVAEWQHGYGVETIEPPEDLDLSGLCDGP